MAEVVEAMTGRLHRAPPCRRPKSMEAYDLTVRARQLTEESPKHQRRSRIYRSVRSGSIRSSPKRTEVRRSAARPKPTAMVTTGVGTLDAASSIAVRRQSLCDGGQSMRAVFLGLLVLAGCATSYEHEVPPLDQETRDRAGNVRIEVEAGDQGAVVGTVSTRTVGDSLPSSFGGFASCAGCSGDAALINLGLILAIVVVALPIAAINGAFDNEDPKDVAAASAVIMPILRAEIWRRNFAVALDSRLPSDKISGNVLRLTLDGPFLFIDGTDAVPVLLVRSQLQAADTCLDDRHWRWNGREDDYVDFGEDDGKALKAELARGADALAAAIDADLFSSTQPRRVVYQEPYRSGLPPAMAQDPADHENEIASWPDEVWHFTEGVPCTVPAPRQAPETAPERDRRMREDALGQIG